MAGGMQKLHEYVDKRHRQLGPIYKEWIGPVPAVFVNSPDDFRRIFYLEGPKPQHFLPESWVLYNEIRAQRRGLLFMYVVFFLSCISSRRMSKWHVLITGDYRNINCEYDLVIQKKIRWISER